MVVQKNVYSEEEYAYYMLAKGISRLSSCIDKQVGAVCVNAGTVTLGYNKITTCNNLCNKTCKATHAEIDVLRGVSFVYSTAVLYLNLFPCENCQKEAWLRGIRKIVVFGEQGNKKVIEEFENTSAIIELLPPLPKLLVNMNGSDLQMKIVQGELAELITAISNFSRVDRAESKEQLTQEVIGEITDVKLQLETLEHILGLKSWSCEEYHKWNKLLNKFGPKFFPGKEL